MATGMDHKEREAEKTGRNGFLAMALAGFAGCMLALSFAAVPLYRAFCAATGYAGTPQRASAAPGKVLAKEVIVRLDANVSPGLPWSFEPEQTSVTVHVGENKLAFFKASNLSDKTVTGSATFNVSPGYMGQYFTKIQCFCFTEQTLGPRETAEMPVSFFIDPAMEGDSSAREVRDMALSYTFHKVKDPASRIGAKSAGGPALANETRNPG
jgi:cytochrome c oxidase assembly protein subunit 11